MLQRLHRSPDLCVSVVIPCYNQARFLNEAIHSAAGQTYPHIEIVVVDDGSTDDTRAVAERYPEVYYVHQENRGLSAARNTGLQHSRGEYVVFLDTDDLLLPGALEAGVRCLAADPECAFGVGRFRRIGEDGSVVAEPDQVSLHRDAYSQLLEGNWIAMHATAMYRRWALEEAGGFDPALPSSEDYDLYLRITRRHPIAQHPGLVAEYRQHGENMSRDPARMLRATVRVLRQQEGHARRDPRTRTAYRRGMRIWREYYGKELLAEARAHMAQGNGMAALRRIGTLLREGGAGVVPLLFHASPLGWRYREIRGRLGHPRVGRVRFGSLRRVFPLSRKFGFDRGQPVDRHYIENFLARNAGDIRGRVLEIGDDTYTRRFGGARVERADILHVSEGNPRATFVGDLAKGEHLPSAAFDCLVLTQTLQFVYDVPAALRTTHRVLKPGGTLLLTVPGISQTSDEQWRDTWYWSFTRASLRRLFEDAFPGGEVRIESHGNVLVASAFLYGLAATELRPEELEANDPDYPLLLAVRAVKRGGEP